jgi:septum formation protein
MITSRAQDRNEIRDLALTAAPVLILASTSPWRRELLARLQLPFECMPPGVDEAELAGEDPVERSERLSIEKAKAVAANRPDALVIGSDQVAVLDGRIADKPGSHERAVEQLRRASGRSLQLHSGLAVVDGRSGACSSRVVTSTVHFRTLSETLIESYLRTEQPYDCAGSARIEGLGIALVRQVESDDPSAIIGLPLIALTTLLGQHGLPVLPT